MAICSRSIQQSKSSAGLVSTVCTVVGAEQRDKKGVLVNIQMQHKYKSRAVPREFSRQVETSMDAAAAVYLQFASNCMSLGCL